MTNFRPFADRSSEERGALWENFIIGERMKRKHNNLSNINLYFWRTYDQQEIDLIEEDGEIITAYEIKSGKKNPKIPKAFANAYPEAAYNIVNRDMFWDYVV